MSCDTKQASDVEMDSDERSTATDSSMLNTAPEEIGVSILPTEPKEREKVAAAAPKATPVSSRKKRKSATLRAEDNVLKLISTAMQQRIETGKRKADRDSICSEDDFDRFGRFVANDLRAIEDPYLRDLVKQQISKLLFDAKWCKADSRSPVIQQPLVVQQPRSSNQQPYDMYQRPSHDQYPLRDSYYAQPYFAYQQSSGNYQPNLGVHQWHQEGDSMQQSVVPSDLPTRSIQEQRQILSTAQGRGTGTAAHDVRDTVVPESQTTILQNRCDYTDSAASSRQNYASEQYMQSPMWAEECNSYSYTSL